MGQGLAGQAAEGQEVATVKGITTLRREKSLRSRLAMAALDPERLVGIRTLARWRLRLAGRPARMVRRLVLVWVVAPAERGAGLGSR